MVFLIICISLNHDELIFSCNADNFGNTVEWLHIALMEFMTKKYVKESVKDFAEM